MHHVDRIAHTTSFVSLVVDHCNSGNGMVHIKISLAANRKE